MAVPGHSNGAKGVIENILRLGWLALLRPRTGALRQAHCRHLTASTSAFGFKSLLCANETSHLNFRAGLSCISWLKVV